MSEPSERTRVPRRLVAILAADIAGYSALMGTDEAQTVRDLKDHLAAVLPMVSAHGGRVIDTAGDGILAEFGSVVNAVECAVAMQKAMTTRNAQIEDGRQMQFRIGINIGDVIHDETRLYGDGVNVAARLEAAAEPGGICISGAAYEQVRNKLALEVGDLGLHSLKNIAEPVRIYRIMTGPSVTPAQARPLLAIPDKPSIAVLPFANLSSNPEQEYLVDGIVDDIITDLSRFSELFVIARNSSFQYNGKSPDIRQVGRELGVRYVLEGSIRQRSGNCCAAPARSGVTYSQSPACDQGSLVSCSLQKRTHRFPSSA
jgi:adenylate cyclase